MPLVSLIIRCYNEEKHIGRLLSGVMQQQGIDYEIIIVDSGSTDATVSIAQRYPIQLISIDPQNFSFGRSLNLGCQQASGEYLVFASPHVYPVYQDWLKQLIAPLQTNPQIALSYGKQRGNNQTQFSEHQIFAQWFPDQAQIPQTTPFCNNANAAIRRDLWQKYPYNEDLTGLEDLDWAKRLMQAGYQIAYVPDAEIIHVHQETPQRVRNRYRREAIALKQIFPEQTFSLGDFVRLTVSNTLSDYYYAWQSQQLMTQLWAIPQFRLMQFWGTYQGYHQNNSLNQQLRQTFYYPRPINTITPNVPSKDALKINYAQSDTQLVPDPSPPSPHQ